MKIVIYALLAIAWMLWLAEPTIKFKPFSISFASPCIAFAWLFLIVSIILFQVDSHNKGYKEGADKAIKTINKIIEEKLSKK